MKAPISKKLIPYLLIGFLVFATLAFITLVGNTDPGDAARKAGKEKAEEEVRATPDSDASEARDRLLTMEKEVRELREREQLAIDAKMTAAKQNNSEDEAKRVAKNLQIDLPRAPAGAAPETAVGVPPKDDAATIRLMEGAQREQVAAASNIGVFENPAAGPVVDAQREADGNNRNGGEDSARSTQSKRASSKEVKNSAPGKVTTPSLPATKKYMLSEGTVIRTVFVTGLNSQIPGKAIVRVTEDVYDSINGANLLIPKGSQIFGNYTGAVKAGQDRMALSFDRLLMPDGRSVRLPKMPAITRTGEAGTDGEYHSNLLPSIMPSLIVGLFGAGLDYLSTKGISESLPTGTTVNSNPGYGAGQAGQSVTRQVFPDISKRLAERYADRLPYFTIAPGATFAVMVTADFGIPPNDDAFLIGENN